MLLNAFPEELLFSRLCRTISVYGMTLREFTASLKLSPRVSFHPLLTEHLEEIAEACQESPEKLWSEQTLFPLWVWSMPRYDKELRRLKSPPARQLRFCQLTGNLEYQGMLLRFCPACAREDTEYYGVAFWHREHQIPGVSACYRHTCRLMSKTVPPRPHISFGLYPDHFHGGQPCGEVERRFASFASDVFHEVMCDKGISGNTLPDMLVQKGYVNRAGHVRKDKLYPLLNEIVSGLWNTPFFPAPSNKERFLSDLINHHDNIFPSRKLLFQFCLQNLPELPQQGGHVSREIFNDSQQSEILRLYTASVSMNEISRRTGKSRCYIRGVIRKEFGTDYTRTRKLTPQTEEYVLGMARKGFHRRYIAKKVMLSIGTIEGIISAHEGLVEWRKQCRYESYRRRSRFNLCKWIQSHPQSGRTEIQMACVRDYYWLYFRERKLLESILPPVRLKYSVKRINWKERDKGLAKKIEIVLSENNMITSFACLDSAVNARGVIIRYRDKLPLTMALIKKHLKLSS